MTDLLTLRELADELGIDYETCRKRIQRRNLQPTKQVGRNNLYSADALDYLRKD